MESFTGPSVNWIPHREAVGSNPPRQSRQEWRWCCLPELSLLSSPRQASLPEHPDRSGCTQCSPGGHWIAPRCECTQLAAPRISRPRAVGDPAGLIPSPVPSRKAWCSHCSAWLWNKDRCTGGGEQVCGTRISVLQNERNLHGQKKTHGRWWSPQGASLPLERWHQQTLKSSSPIELWNVSIRRGSLGLFLSSLLFLCGLHLCFSFYSSSTVIFGHFCISHSENT